MKRHPEVWEALLPQHGPDGPAAQPRQDDRGWSARSDCRTRSSSWSSRLSKAEALRTARVHPLALLVALKTYGQGHGDKGKLTWKPRQKIVDALDRAFYLSFETLAPTGARTLLALDVSGSMTGPPIAGMPGISPRVGSAAMALVTAAVEPRHDIVAFTNGKLPFALGGLRQRHLAARDLAAHAPRRGGQGDVSDLPVRRHGLRAAHGVGGRQQGAGRRVLRVHGQRDLGG